MISLNIKMDLRPVHRAMIDLRAKQVPFAAALALTRLAQGAANVEAEQLVDTLEKATPFTRRAFRIESATKSKPFSVVAIKDQTNDKGGQAAYLAPYVNGGPRFMGGKRAMLVPIDQRTNQYGNLPKGTLARLKARPDVFIGPVHFAKSGKTISGVWQRSAVKRGTRSRQNGYGTRGDSQGKVAGARTTLKLLIEFENTTPAKKHFDFRGIVERYVRKNAAAEFTAAMRQANATARR